MSNGYESYEIEQESGEATGNNATVSLGGREIELPITELEDINHPNVPETNQEYLPREINGKRDLEILAYAVNDPDFFAMLEGEAAVGKNFSIDKLCEVANWPRVRVNFSISSSYESLVGRYAPVDNTDVEDETLERGEVIENVGTRLRQQSGTGDPYRIAENAIPEASSFQWVDGLLTRAVKNGWMFVADEINAADSDAVMPLNGLTEDRDSRYLTIEEKSEVIEPHDRFRFVATRNPVTYSGVSDMNSALESRAYIIPYDYHEDRALVEIISSRTEVVQNESEEALTSVIDLVQRIRQQEQSGTQFVTKVSTRDLIKICRLTDIMDIRDACKTVILGIADPTDKEALKEEIKDTKFQ
jgi:nitric oxide reductase NorQ protein/cobaltochelatase CobS